MSTAMNIPVGQGRQFTDAEAAKIRQGLRKNINGTFVTLSDLYDAFYGDDCVRDKDSGTLELGENSIITKILSITDDNLREYGLMGGDQAKMNELVNMQVLQATKKLESASQSLRSVLTTIEG